MDIEQLKLVLDAVKDISGAAPHDYARPEAWIIKGTP